LCKELYRQGGKYGNHERSRRNSVSHELLKDYHGPDGLVKQLSKTLIERVMRASNQRFALTGQLGYEKSNPVEKLTAKRRNGKTVKTLRTDQGPMAIEVPRDREGTFEPQIVGKHPGNEVSPEWRGFDEKILSMYGLGLSGAATQEHLKDRYNVDVSPELISRVTDEVKGLVSATALPRNGGTGLEAFYPVLFMDALRVNIRDEGQVSKKGGISDAGGTHGRTKRAGMWMERNEGAKFWYTQPEP
jgi:transposase-like protein